MLPILTSDTPPLLPRSSNDFDTFRYRPLDLRFFVVMCQRKRIQDGEKKGVRTKTLFPMKGGLPGIDFYVRKYIPESQTQKFRQYGGFRLPFGNMARIIDGIETLRKESKGLLDKPDWMFELCFR